MATATAMGTVTTWAMATATGKTWAMATAMRVAGDKEGKGGKGMVSATIVASDDIDNKEGNDNSNEGGRPDEAGKSDGDVDKKARTRIIIKPTTL